jgi:hypothetical protein
MARATAGGLQLSYEELQQMQDQLNKYKGFESELQQYKARPQDVKFEGVTDETGQLKDIYKTQFTGDKYKDIAGQALGQTTKGARQTAAQQAMGAQANARSQMAQKGGMQGGMASRLAQTGMQQQMLANQQIGSDLAKGRGDIEQKAFDINAGAEKANLALMTGDVGAKRDFSMDKYKTQMGEWASRNLSDAQKQYAPKAGKK